MDEEEVLLVMGYILLMHRQKEKIKKRARKMWVHEIYTRRETGGIYYTLVQEMALGDRELTFFWINL